MTPESDSTARLLALGVVFHLVTLELFSTATQIVPGSPERVAP